MTRRTLSRSTSHPALPTRDARLARVPDLAHSGLGPPLPVDALEAAEAALAVALPEPWRTFVGTVADGGAGPGDGLWTVAEAMSRLHAPSDAGRKRPLAAGQFRASGEQETPRPRNGQHELAHRDVRERLLGPAQRALGRTTAAARGAEPAATRTWARARRLDDVTSVRRSRGGPDGDPAMAPV